MLVVVSALFDKGSSQPRVIAAIREADLAEGLAPDAAAEGQRLAAASGGAFAAAEVIVVPPGTDIAGATLAAKSWAYAEARRLANLAMLFYWDQDNLPTVNRGGILSGTMPVPHASEEDVARVLVALSRSPEYRDQRIVAISRDWIPVAMRGGKTARLGRDAAAILRLMHGAPIKPRLLERLGALIDAALPPGRK